MLDKEHDKLIGHREIDLEPLSNLAFTEACELWNEGFKGYAVDLSMSLDDYVARLNKSSLSIERSLVARANGRLVGFLLNGFRNHSGKHVAWNGGTGVIPEFRGRGIGRVLVEAALQIYADEKVDYATLEAISTNSAAIALYKSCGYEPVAELTFLQHDGFVDFSLNEFGYVFEEVPPSQVSRVTFYDPFVPWQAHWQSLNENCGRGLIIYRESSPAGYALFRKQFSSEGKLKSITLHDCVADPSKPDREGIVSCMLRHVFSPLSIECHRSTHNFKASNRVVIDLLQDAGFTTFIEQVMMKKEMK